MVDRQYEKYRYASAWIVLAVLLCLPGSALGQASWATAYLLLAQDKSNLDDGNNEELVSTSTPESKPALPEWITNGSYTDADGTEFYVVKTDFQFSEEDADHALKQEIVKSISELFDQQIEPGAGEIIGYSYAQVRDRWVYQNTYVAVEESTESMKELGVQKTYTKYAQINTDAEFMNQARSVWHEKVVRSRVQQTSVIGFAVLGVLGIVFGCMHINRVSRGFYSGRLQLIGLASILILIAMAVAVSETFEWF